MSENFYNKILKTKVIVWFKTRISGNKVQKYSTSHLEKPTALGSYTCRSQAKIGLSDASSKSDRQI